jgi:hypothetical protein
MNLLLRKKRLVKSHEVVTKLARAEADALAQPMLWLNGTMIEACAVAAIGCLTRTIHSCMARPPSECSLTR